MSKAGAAFSVRFLRNGDQIVVTRDILHADGSGAALFQIVDTVTGSVAPKWTVEANQPIIQLGVRSSAGFTATIQEVRWAFDGTDLIFPTISADSWTAATNDSRFQAKIAGNYWCLKIVGNIAGVSQVANKQINYSVDYLSNAMADTVTGGVDVLIQAAGSNSHTLQITTNRVELQVDDPDTTSVNESQATLTAVSYYGTSPVTIGQSGYTLQWYQDGVAISGATSSTLLVTRDMVEGGSLFVCKLSKDGTVVAQDSQRIADIADEYQITFTPTNAGANWVGIGHNATYNLGLTKNGSAYAGTVTYNWQVYNALGEAKGSGGSGSTVTVTADECICGSGDNAYYSDADVLVTADIQ